MRYSFFLLVLAISVAAQPKALADWKPASGRLMTRWAKDVAPDRAHADYPRPQMVRKDWLNLNGLWDYAIRPRDDDLAKGTQAFDGQMAFDGQILVPFPVESALSGVMKPVGDDKRLWYRRQFTVPPAWAGKRVLLHFGAVDWEVTVWINGRKLGEHRGGYDPFSLDITAALRDTETLRDTGAQEILVAVWDPSNKGTQPCGKQHQNPNGIWYTAVTGIWQTVWLEPVPERRVERLKLVPDVDSSRLLVSAEAQGEGKADRVRAVASTGGKEVGRATGNLGESLSLGIESPKLWSPETPFLYDLRLELLNGGTVIDQVESYFAMRKVSLGKDEDGITRIFLNSKLLFLHGPLDQGWWPDGLYTAPTDEALRYDIEATRKLGFNMCRKHVKVEPARWYYWCDKLGLIVWQDMPSTYPHVDPGKGEIRRSEESGKQFEIELRRLIDAFGNHPSIILWVVFNEGWGQYDTARLTKWVKEYDPTRLADCASGWNDMDAGDVHDIHSYPGPDAPKPEKDRAAVLGEYGGLGLPVAGHTWQDEKNWGYRSFTNTEALTKAYLELSETLWPLIRSPGLSAAVYTQTTDVEIEVNGLMTYDRALIKMDAERIAAANRRLHLPPPILRPLVPTSEADGLTWRYTTVAPPAGWERPDFDDKGWKEGPGGFGAAGTPGALVRTEWKTPEIWIRRSFALQEAPRGKPRLRLHHDEDAEVYLNGMLAATLSGYSTGYTTAPLDEKARAVLRPGRNTLAVHCKQTAGGQYIDAGLVELVEKKE